MAACSSSSIINRNLAAWHGAEDCVSDDKAPLTQSSTSGCVVRFARCRSEERVAVFVGEIFEPNHLLLTDVVLEGLLRLLLLLTIVPSILKPSRLMSSKIKRLHFLPLSLMAGLELVPLRCQGVGESMGVLCLEAFQNFGSQFCH